MYIYILYIYYALYIYALIAADLSLVQPLAQTRIASYCWGSTSSLPNSSSSPVLSSKFLNSCRSISGSVGSDSGRVFCSSVS